MSDRQTRSSTRRKVAPENLSSQQQQTEIKQEPLTRTRRRRVIVNLKGESSEINTKSAPISTLPTEILCHIFLIAQDSSRSSGIPENPLVEVVISHVCKRWRRVATSLPNLWTCFRYKYTLKIARVPHDRLAAYLERSKPLLLDISFDLRLFDEILPDGHEWPDTSLVESTIPHASRWRRMSFISDDMFGSATELYAQLALVETPHLESYTMCPDGVDLDFGYDSDSDDEEEEEGEVHTLQSRILKKAPKLSYVCLDSSYPRKCIPSLSNVTVLRLEDEDSGEDNWLGWKAFLQIFELPALTSLSICGCIVARDDEDQRLIEAPRLKHLRLGDEEDFAVYFLHHLSAPSLETLMIQRMDLIGVELWTMTYPPLRSFPLLRVLGLVDAIVDTLETLEFVLSLAPNIVHLIISFEPETTCSLVDHLSRTAAWPRLRQLTWGMTKDSLNTHCEAISPYVTLASARKKFGVPLHTMRVEEFMINLWRQRKLLKSLEKHCKVIEPITDEFDFEAPWPGRLQEII